MSSRITLTFVFINIIVFSILGQNIEINNCAKILSNIERINQSIELPDSILLPDEQDTIYDFPLKEKLSVDSNLYISIMIGEVHNINVNIKRPLSINNYKISEKEIFSIKFPLIKFNPYSEWKCMVWISLINKSKCNETDSVSLIKTITTYSNEYADKNKKITVRLKYIYNGVLKNNSDYLLSTNFKIDIKTNQDTKDVTFLRKQKEITFFIDSKNTNKSQFTIPSLYLKNDDELIYHRLEYSNKLGYKNQLTSELTELLSYINLNHDNIMQKENEFYKWIYIDIYIIKHIGQYFKIFYRKYGENSIAYNIISGQIELCNGKIIRSFHINKI